MIKKVLLLLISVHLLFVGYNYSEEKKETPDELKEQLKIVKYIKKAGILIKLAEAYNYDKDKSLSFNYAKKALELSKKYNQKEEETDALGLISKNYRRKKMYKKAFEFAYLRLKKTKEYNLEIKEIYALSDIGYIHYIKQEHKKAIEYGNDALKLAEKLKDKKAQLYALDEITESIQNDYLKVLRFFKKRKIITDELGDKKEMVLSTHLLATIHLYLNDIKTSKQLYIDAMKQYESNKNHAKVIQLMSYIGSFLKKQEKYDQGLKYLHKAQKYYSNIKKKDKGIEISYGRILSLYGEINFEKKNYKKAIEYFNMMIIHAKKVKSDWLLIIAHEELADVFIDMKKYDIAKDYIQKCFDNEYGEDLGFWKERFNTNLYSKLGKIYHQIKKYDKAIITYEKNLINVKKYFYLETVSEIYKQLGKIYLEKRDPKKAIENLMKSIEYSKKYNKGLLIPKNKILKEDYKILSEIYKKIGDKKLEQKYLELYNITVENLNKVVL